MLRELIYALNGYHGEVFCFDEKTKAVHVANDLPFIQPSEKAILNKICTLSSYFIKFKTFVEETLDFQIEKNQTKSTTTKTSGIYIKAFARALNAYLQVYQGEMVLLERMVGEDEFVGLSSIQSHTQKFQIIFPVLSGIIDNVVGNKLQGCCILDVLYKASNTGILEVQAVLRRILQMCNVVFYKHLSLWMIHGVLPQDLNNNNKKNNNINNNNDNNNNKNNNKIIINDNNNDNNNINNNNNKNMMDEFIIKEVKVTDEREGDANDDKLTKDNSLGIFEVNVGQLPSFVSLSFAERILFVGQSVVLFKNGKNADQRFKRNVDDCLISVDKEKNFQRHLSILSRTPVFDACSFQNTVHLIRNHVAQQLYILIVEKSDLQRQLRSFKDFFLIGRGELFLAFIDQSHNLLTNPPNNTTQYDVNLAFEHSCRDMLMRDEHTKQFTLIIKTDETDNSKTTTETATTSTTTTTSSTTTSKHFLKGRKNGWSCLQMTAFVDWPLHVLFTQPIIDKYNRLFSFLLLAKRIQLQLLHCWSLQRRNNNKNNLNATKRRMRNHMSFFIDNLQYYLQVDVIDSQFSVLLSKLDSHRDFEQILLAHEAFLNALLNQCFLHSRQINSCLASIFDLCQAYYGLVVYSSEVEEKDDGGGGDDDGGLHGRLKEVEEAFRKQSHLLFEMLSTNARCNNHLSLLLLRIDFNRYFSKIVS